MKRKIVVDRIIKNASMILTMDKEFNCITDGAIAVDGGKIVELGATANIQKKFTSKTIEDAAGGVITPGLIECHTHIIFSKTRENEYLDKLAGKPYTEILLKGGGINASADHLRTASVKDLVKQGMFWLEEFLKYGITCVEIKTGYGLDYASERKMLEAISLLKKKAKQVIVPTFLAHIIPQQYKETPQEYIKLIKNKMLPDFRQYTDSFDIFVEKGAFSYEQADDILNCAKQFKYNVKIHANQISSLGAIELAKKYHAISVDHVDNTSEREAKLLGTSGAVAVLLPGASYFMKSTHMPPVDAFNRYGVPIAISTDFNPGTCPTPNLHLMMSMAVHMFNMTIQDVWSGVTINAAKALLLDKTMGSLEEGKLAHMVLWKMPNFIYPFYHFGMNFVAKTWLD